MTQSRLLSAVLAAAFLASATTGCSCNGKSRRIECIDPVTGQTITNADDINATTPGIQIGVTCTVRGFDIGDPLQLNVHDDVTGASRDYTLPYDGTGTVEFSPVSLQGGTTADPSVYTMVASGNDGDVTSNSVTVNVVAETTTCPEFDFIDPEDGDEWNQSDDSNSDLSDGFQHNVVITTDAGDAESVSLYLNDALVGTGTVDGTRIEFTDVTFPSGGGDMELRIQTTDACFAEAMVTIDDASPTCNITAPMPTDPAGWINASFDASTSAGMQADVTVDTEDGATVELFVDTALTETPTDSTNADSSGTASFSGVSLSEAAFGELTLQARCTDSAGNIGVSSLNEYGVDSILPTISITDPTGGENYNDDDDVNDTLTGVQINVSIASDQPSTVAEIHPCSGAPLVPEGTPTTDTDGNATGELHLGGTDGDVDICATITKVSGNSATAGPVTVTLDTALPQVQVVDPDGTSPILNADDENTSTAGCQYTVEIECDAIGYPVVFYDEVAGELGNGTCATDSGSSLGGSVSFQVTLPEGDRVVYATHTDAAANEGESTHVSVTVKSVLPVVSWNIPSSCPWNLYASGSAFETVRVQSTDSPVTLTVLDGGGSGVGSSPYTETVSGVFAVFSSVELATGANTMQACATDAYSQTGCTSTCNVTVNDIPRIIFVAPTDAALLGITDDLDGSTAGCQMDVTFTADVAASSGTELIVDSTSVGTMPYGSSSVTYTSVTIPEGSSISIEGCATDGRGTGCETIHVTCDVTRPTTITDLSSTVTSRRGGEIRLSWTAPNDSGASVSGYEIACDTSDITDTTTFDAGTSHSFSGVVGAPSSAQNQDITGLRIENTHYCSVRSYDAVGNRSDVANPSTNQLLEFLTSSYDGASGSSSYTGWQVTALGDVNGDSVDDFAVGTFQNTVLIYLGSSSSLPTTPDVTITSPSGVAFGATVAGIGKFNNDSYMDVAIGDMRVNSNKGAVYVFLGRASWPATLTDANADLIFQNNHPTSTDDDGAYFGSGLDTAGDFDNDTLSDILVGAQYWAGDNGVSYVLLGRNPMPSFGTVIDVPGDRSTGFVGDFQITSPVVDSRFGTRVSAAGRLNSDSFHDVIIGAPGGVSGVPLTGFAYLIYGRSSGSSGLTTISSMNVSITSPATGEVRFGNRVAGLGDFNGDSYNDVAVGATYYPDGSDNRGAIYVYYNNSGSGPDTTHDIMITNDTSSPTGDWLGNSLARGWNHESTTTCDVDDDGTSDFLYAPNKYNAGDPKVFVDFGGTSVSSHAISASDIMLDSISSAGGSNAFVTYAGDIDDDSYIDILIGNPYHNSYDGGFIIYY